MRLLACQIENFGKLSNFSMNFSEGLTVINEENGWGKSTLATFLKVMFYGFDAKKDKEALDKERKLYQPWQGGTYGGSLDFEKDGKQYRILRTFAKTEKGDEFHLYDLATNLECEDYSANIGEELFDIDSASFKRSIYLVQSEVLTDTSDGIHAKLGNLVENTNDMNSYEAAMERLKNLSNALTPSRATGSLKKRKGQIVELKQELIRTEVADESVSTLKHKMQELTELKQTQEETKRSLLNRVKAVSEADSKKEKQKHYQFLVNEANRKRGHLKEWKANFPGTIPEEEALRDCLEKARSLSEYETSMQNFSLTEEEKTLLGQAPLLEGEHNFHYVIQLSEELKELRNQISQKEQQKELLTTIAKQGESTQISHYEELAEKKITKTAGIVMSVGGGILLICGVLLALMRAEALPIGLGLLGVGILGVIIGAGKLIAADKKARRLEALKKARELEEVHQKEKWEPVHQMADSIAKTREEYERKQKEIESFLRRFQMEGAPEQYTAMLYELKNKAAQVKRLQEKSAKQIEARERFSELQEEIVQYLASCEIHAQENLISQLSVLRTQVSEYKNAVRDYEQALERVNAFEATNEMAHIYENMDENLEDEVSIEELNQQIRQADEAIEESRGYMEAVRIQLESLQAQLDELDEKKALLAELEAQQEEEAHQFTVVSEAQKYLQGAREQLTARYMAPISKGFEKYFQMLTSCMDKDWMVDANMELKMKERGEYRDARWFSEGYQDLIGICMRLALVDAMYEGEKPFLLLDDPFVNLDENKVKNGNQMLCALAKEYQTIYFTCHSSRTPELY